MANTESGFDPPPRVLIIEDDKSVSDSVFAALTMDGYTVVATRDGTGLEATLKQFRPDLVVLDVYLPDGPDGFELAGTVEALSGAPVIFLTAAAALHARLRGFELGADDYIVKPFSMAELLARVRVVLRRAGRLASPTWQVGDLVVDEASRTLVRAGPEADPSA